MAPVLMLAARLYVTVSITGGYHPLVFVASSPSGRQARSQHRQRGTRRNGPSLRWSPASTSATDRIGERWPPSLASGEQLSDGRGPGW